MKKAIFPSDAPRPVAPYSPAIDAGDTIYLSGQIALDSETGKIIDGGVVAEAELVFKNIRSVLAEAGLEMDSVVKSTVFLTDLTNFAAINPFFAENFSEPRPARSTIQVAGLPLGAQIEIEVIARRNL